MSDFAGPTVVSHDLSMQVVQDNDSRVAMNATLSYDAHDPFAVTASFRPGEEEISWVFARELLRDGLVGPAGEGDITIRPGHPSRGALVLITLSSPAGEARIEANRHDLSRFVEASYKVLPEGEEWQYMQVERVISDLLAEQ